jgi:aspartate/methionine/tyrosine aminotransferase
LGESVVQDRANDALAEERMASETSRCRSPLALARRMDAIEPFHVMEIARRAAELEAAGRRIVHLEIGQPDFGAPPPVLDAAAAALARESLGYSAALGKPALRKAIARFYAERHGYDVSHERIVITAGASGAFLLAMGALVEPGDEVLMPDPCYPCNRHFVRMFGGEVRSVAVDETQHYQLTAADVARHWTARTRGVLLATPSNPTGTTIAPAELARIVAAVRARGGWCLVDEIYGGLVYEQTPTTALALADDIIVVNSFSKYFNMTGWRLGWMVVPPSLVSAIERLAQNAFICVSVPAQHAALAAFQPDALEILEARRREFQRRRDFLVPALRDLGFRIPRVPEGAFYVYAGCEAFARDSETLAWSLLEDAGVAVTPGRDFGEHDAQRHIRFAYTRSLEDLAEGVRRIGRYLGR